MFVKHLLALLMLVAEDTMRMSLVCARALLEPNMPDEDGLTKGLFLPPRQERPRRGGSRLSHARVHHHSLTNGLDERPGIEAGPGRCFALEGKVRARLIT